MFSPVRPGTDRSMRRMRRETAVVEPSYKGARLEGPDENQITLDFIMQMKEDFRNQKTIHTRYAFEVMLQVMGVLKASSSLMEIGRAHV